MTARLPPLLRPALAALGLLLGAGCASTSMKGTPFYTGEYSTRLGPAEDRINLWPLMYYRDPALSVAWPFVEKTEDHFAIRPLMSVYGLDRPAKTVNVLWPLAQFDGSTGSRRVFPLFWGRNYATLFPFYWHFDHPLGPQGGYDGLLPLWSYHTTAAGYDFSALWPVFQVKSLTTEKGWRLWPLAGNYADGADHYRFALWPLCHQWYNDRSSTTTILPLFSNRSRPEEHLFVSLPYSFCSRTDDSGWQCLPPLFFHSANRDESAWLTPLHYVEEGPDRRLVASWLGGYRRVKSSTDWLAIPLLAGGSHTPNSSSTWWAGPLIHTASSSNRLTHQVLPLYHYRRNETGSLLVSLPWSRGRGADGTAWDVVPPLFFRIRDQKSSAYGVFPLYYLNDDRGTFISLLSAQWKKENGDRIHLVPPVASWLTVHQDDRDLWLLAGLGHFSWGPGAGTSHLFPFYYSAPESGCMITPLVASWMEGRMKHWLVPPLLSSYASDGDHSSLRIAFGLFGNDTDRGQGRRNWLLPVYTYEKGKHFYTPLAGWKHDDRQGFVYPLTPLVGFWTGDVAGGWLFPLFSRERNRTTGDCRGTFLWGQYARTGKSVDSSLLPLYSYERWAPLPDLAASDIPAGRYGKRFWSLPACWYRNQVNVQPEHHRPSQTNTPATLRTVSLRENGCFPLWSYSRRTTRPSDARQVNASLLLLLYDYQRRTTPSTPSATPNDYVRSRVLWRLWHYERSNSDVSLDIFPAITHDRRADGFRKTSFLWRFYRYEKGPDGTKMDLLFIPIMRRGAADTKGPTS